MSRLKVQGIVFDLDATLINLGGFVEWRKAHEEIVENYLELDCDDETVAACSAKGLFTMLEEMYENLQYQKGDEEARSVQDSAYDILSDWIKEKGVPMGICTSNSLKSAEAALDLQGISHYFKVVVGRNVDFPMKPHPAQLVECFRQISVEPSRGVMVGDSHKDIIAGKKAGAFTIGVPVYFTRLELMKDADVDVIINNLNELPAVLEGLYTVYPSR